MEWISVSCIIPKAYEVVLVLTKYNRHYEDHHHGETIPEWEDVECHPIYDIAHWMPLPQPPKE